jgi:hypothetical protein
MDNVCDLYVDSLCVLCGKKVQVRLWPAALVVINESMDE